MKGQKFIGFLSFIAINYLIFIVIADKLKCDKNETYIYEAHKEKSFWQECSEECYENNVWNESIWFFNMYLGKDQVFDPDYDPNVKVKHIHWFI